jgi:hypothetical protein
MARKRRCLENGRWYKNTTGMKRALGVLRYNADPANAKARAKTRLTRSIGMKSIQHTCLTPEVIKRKTASVRKFHRKNPGFMKEVQRKILERHPELREQRRVRTLAFAEKYPESRTHFTKAKNVERRRTHRNGKQVIRIVRAERRKTVGVVVNDNF